MHEDIQPMQNNEATPMDVIVTGIQPWDIEIGSNCKNIATEMARTRRVLYVNPPLDRITRYRESGTPKVQKRMAVIQGKTDGIEQLHDTLWVMNPPCMIESINKVGSPFIFDRLNRRNNRLFARAIQQGARDLGFKDYWLFNDQHMFLGQYLKEYLNPTLYVYYIRDNLIKNPYWKKQGERLEPQLIGKADLVVTNSVYYKDYAAKYNQHSYMVGQGCDTSLFDESLHKIDIPDDLSAIEGPRIGYVGYLTHRRLDISLIEYLAVQRPEWKIVLVGPEDDVFKASGLHQMPNVIFMGSRKPEELPAYVKGFDVAINPQVLNDATIGNYPRKIDEYLTIGRPVVATRTQAMEYFKEVVYLGETQQDYIDLIEKAIQEDSQESRGKRIETGKNHSWGNNVAAIDQYVHQMLQ